MACELETLDIFEPFVDKYKDILASDGLYILFVTDLDESSVWNELLDHADLSKGDLKKTSTEETIVRRKQLLERFRLQRGSFISS